MDIFIYILFFIVVGVSCYRATELILNKCLGKQLKITVKRKDGTVGNRIIYYKDGDDIDDLQKKIKSGTS